MDVTLICSMLEELPRQGPGLDEATAYALKFIPAHALRGKILDIGCGSGMHTLALARICQDCQITSIDVHQPFLDELQRRAEKAGVDGKIVIRKASMDNLPFDEGSFDIIWAEGSSFIIGIQQALAYWKKFLKPDGYMMISDLTWFTDNPSEACKQFMQEISPDTPSESDVKEMIRSEGYSFVGSFRLADAGWLDNFYNPLENRLGLLKEKYADNPDAQALIRGFETEIEIFRNHSDEYGYTYYIMKYPGPER